MVADSVADGQPYPVGEPVTEQNADAHAPGNASGWHARSESALTNTIIVCGDFHTPSTHSSPSLKLTRSVSGAHEYYTTYASLQGKIVSRGTFSASTKEIRSVEFLSNDSLVAGGNDAVVRFWNVPSGSDFTDTTPAQTIATHWGAITVMSYSASLGLLATGSTIGSRVWDTEPVRVAAHICQTLKAPIQPALWNEYLPDIPYTPVCS